MADGAVAYEDGDSPPPRSHSHSHADYGFDEHRENGERDRKRSEVLLTGLRPSLESAVLFSLAVPALALARWLCWCFPSFFTSCGRAAIPSVEFKLAIVMLFLVTSCGPERERTCAAFFLS